MKKTITLLFFSFSTFFFHACKEKDLLPLSGLIGYYNLNGDANDANDPQNNGVLKNTSPTTDRFGNTNGALAFNGKDSYIELPVNQLINDEFTYAAWVKYDEIPFNINSLQGVGTIIDVFGSKGDHALVLANTIVKGWGLWTYTDPNANGNYAYEGSLPTNTEKWYHIVATRSVGELKIYVDSQLVAENVNLSGKPAYGENVVARIGSRCNNTFYFKGKIDDVRIYNKVLSELEVQNLYNEKSK